MKRKTNKNKYWTFFLRKEDFNVAYAILRRSEEVNTISTRTFVFMLTVFVKTK